MRERTESIPKHGIGSRLLAMMLTLAMLFGVCPAAFAAGEAKFSIGNPRVSFVGTAVSDGTVSTGTVFGLSLNVAFNADDNGVENPQVKLYIGDMNTETFTSIAGGGKIAGAEYIADGVKYSVQYDNAKGNYILIEKYDTATNQTKPWVGGDTLITTLGVEFDVTAENGATWTPELVVTGAATSPTATVTAQSSVVMNNKKTVDTSSVVLAHDASTLGQDIVYKLSAFTGTEPDNSTKLSSGEAVVAEYTVTDTLDLSTAGLYIEGSTANDAAAAISSSIPGYVIEVPDQADNKITKIVITYKVSNSDTSKQIENFSGTVTLNGSLVKADGLENGATGKYIGNSVATAYKTVNSTSETAVTPASITTNVIKANLGSYKNPKKEIAGVVSNYNTWNSGSGYLVEGDYVLYKVSYSNASDYTTFSGGTVSDDVSKAGLSLIGELTDDEYTALAQKLGKSVDNIKAGAWAESGSADITRTGTTVSFSNIAIDGGKSFEGYILAKLSTPVSGETVRRINEATVGDVTVSAAFKQQKLAPHLTIDKSVVNNSAADNTKYNANDSLTYTVTVKNDGTAAMTGINLKDLFPTGAVINTTSLPSATATEGESSTTEEGSSTIKTIEVETIDLGTFDLGPGESKTFTLTGTVKSDAKAEQIKNTAIAYYTDPDSSEQAQISADAVLTRQNPASSVTITKTGDKDGQYAQRGSTVNYTITVDMGDKLFTSDEPLVVADKLPEGLTYSSSSYEKAEGTEITETVSGSSVSYSITGSGTVKITLSATVNSNVADGTAFNNTAMIFGGSSASSGTATAGTPDAVTAVKTGVVKRNGAEVGTITSDRTAEVKPGDEITFYITITNNSHIDTNGNPAALTEFTLHDTLVGKYVADSANNGDWVSTVNQWTQNTNTVCPIRMTVAYVTDGVQGFNLNAIWGEKNWGDATDYGTNDYINFVDNSASANSSYSYADGLIDSYGTSDFLFTTNISVVNENNIIKSWRNRSLSIPIGGSVTMTYTVTAADSFTAGSNRVSVDSYQASTVSYVNPTPTPTPVPSPTATPKPGETAAPTEVPETERPILSIKKELTDYSSNPADRVREFAQKTDGSDSFDVTEAEVYYTVTITNESKTLDYVSKNAVLYDFLPAELGLKMQASSRITANVWCSTGGLSIQDTNDAKLAYIGENDDYKNSALWKTTTELHNGQSEEKGVYEGKNALMLSLHNETDDDGNLILKIPKSDDYNTSCVKIVYALKLNDATKQAFNKEIANNGRWYFDERKAVNTAYFTADEPFKNTDGRTVNVIDDTQTVILRSQAAHPGIEKKAYAYLEESGHEIHIGSAGAHPGARLIWKLKVTNDKMNGGGADLTDYTITDELPDKYRYKEDQSYTNSHGTPVTYPTDLTKSTGYDTDSKLADGKFVIHRVNGTIEEIEYGASGVTFTNTDNVLTWHFDGDKNASLKLAPGDWLEFAFITEPTSNVHESGVYYNKARLRVGNDWYDSAVTVGTVEEGLITDGDSFSINTIITSGEISVKVPASPGATESPSVSGKDSPNTLTVSADTKTVEYTLNVKNNDASGQSLKNLSIINRLPYEGDSGVIVSGQRGSQYNAVYDKGTPITITIHRADGTTEPLTTGQYTFTTYSGDISKVFDEYSDDWSNLDADGWSSTADASTKLIRIQIGSDDNPIMINSGDHVTVTYNVTLPDVSGDSALTGWNGFAYHYDSASGTTKNMAAEPASVGVVIPANSKLTGLITVKKVFASDTAEEREFWFKCVDSTGKQYGDVKSLKLTSSGDINVPVNAEIVFDGLPYTDIGKEVRYTIYETNDKGEKLTQSGTPFVMYTGFYRPDKGDYTKNGNNFTYAAKTGTTYDKGCELTYVGDTASLEKGISTSKTTNSAIFSNILWSDASYKILGVFYADVPTNAEAAATDSLSSTRDIDKRDGSTVELQQSSVRGSDNNAYKDADANRAHPGAYDGFGESENGHTIATGFLAEITAGADAIDSIAWKITTKAAEGKDVYMRGPTITPAPEDGSENAMLGSVNVDPTAAYSDGSGDTGYSIYKVKPNDEHTITLSDTLSTTISGYGTAYVGIIIDQLYDPNATAEILFNTSGVTDTVAMHSANVDQKGTKVEKRREFIVEALHTFKQLETGVYTFDDFAGLVAAGDKAEITAETLSNNGFIKLLADDALGASGNPSHNVTVKTTTGAWKLKQAVVSEDENGNATAVMSGDVLGSYTTRIHLNGTGKLSDATKYRAIAVNAKAGQTISVYAVSANATSNRKLNIADENYNIVATGDAPMEKKETIDEQEYVAAGVITFTAAADGTCYIYSPSSGVNVYAVKVADQAAAASE